MPIVSTSCDLQDQSPTYAQRMLYLNERLYNDPPFTSRCFAEFDHDPQFSSSALFSVEEFQQQFAGTRNASDSDKKIYPEAIALSSGASAISREIEPVMQGRVASYPISQHLSIGHESFERGLSGDFVSLGFNELADVWGDLRLYSQETASVAAIPPQRHGWVEGSTSCSTSGDPMSSTAPVEFDTPPQCSYTIPTCSETSAGEGNQLECPRPLQPEQSSHSSRPVATSIALGGLNPPLIYHGSPRSSKSDAFRPRSSSRPPEDLGKAIPSLQPSISQKSRFHSQSLARDRVQDAAAVEHFSDTVDDSEALGPRQHNFVKRAPCLSMGRSPDEQRGHQPRERGSGGKARQHTSANLNHLKFKQKSLAKPAPRKHQRRRALDDGIDMDNCIELDSVPTPLDHVQRERQRRDHMTAKIAALELLLPKTSKRDRVSVVYDAIQLLKRLEQEVKDLRQRFHDAKLRRAGHKQSRDPGRLSMRNSIDYNVGTSERHFSKGIVIKRMGKYMKPVVDIHTQTTRDTSGKSRPTQRYSMMSSTQCVGGSNIREKGDVFVEFHVHLDDPVTAREEKVLKCRCRMDYLSTMIGVVDEFQLDVISCNIMKLSGYFICIMGLKTRTRAETTTAAQFAVRLQSVVDVDIGSEAITTSLSGAKISESIEN